MVNGKQKGSQYEREISKTLSLWLSNNKYDDLFWRSHSSGGRFTQRFKNFKNTINQSGDITSTCKISEEFIKHFTIECKFYKEISLWDFVTGNKNGIVKFWIQTINESKSANKHPLLILKSNYKPVLLITNNYVSDKLKKISDVEEIMIINNEIENCVIYLFENFLNINPQQIIQEFNIG